MTKINPDAPHIPVLIEPVLKVLDPQPKGVYVDGTFGAGGYSSAILDAAPECIVYGIDRDPSAIATAEKLAAEKYPNRLIPVRGCFGDMYDLIHPLCPEGVDGIVLDIGVSSMQIDNGDRGFSFQKNGPLDMRMDPENGMSAADVVNTVSENDLADILYQFGEERKSRRIARTIVAHRAHTPIHTTNDLTALIHQAIPPRPQDKIDPATRSFQALRIYVNDELGELKRGLSGGENLLKPKGCFAVVTFHSLEERIVKNFFREGSGLEARGSRHMPDPHLGMPDSAIKTQHPFRMTNKKGILPDAQETARNPRARSARLRFALRT